MNYEVPTWLKDFESAILTLDTNLRNNCGELSLEEAADALILMNRFKDYMKIIYDDLAKVVSDLMDQAAEINASDGSKIEKKGDVSRTGWQHKDLANEVINRLTQMAVDMDTGEMLMTGPEMAMRMLDFIQPSYWRIKELGNLGINPDNFSKVGDYKESIIVRKAK